LIHKHPSVTYPPPGLQSEDLKSSRDNLALHLVIGSGDALVHLEAVHGLLAATQLVGEHATDRAPQDLAGAAEMERAMGGVGVHALAQKLGEVIS
jgi:hypothetical protein